MLRILSLFCASLLSLSLMADNVKKMSITYEYVSDNPNESPEQAERTAYERAKLKVMEDHFGLDVSSVNSIIQRQRQEGKESSSSTDVFALRQTSVRGEWIATIEQKTISKTFENNFWHVKVYIEGKARNLSKEKVHVEYALVNHLTDKDNRDQYRDNDDLFLRFSSPVSGHLCVYLVDETHHVYCLLPYPSNTTGSHVIEANQEYLFFSQKKDPKADEYVMTTAHEQEQDAIYIIFTPNGLIKANDHAGEKNFRNQDLPRELTYKDFLNWLSKNQTKDEDMVVLTEVITIKK